MENNRYNWRQYRGEEFQEEDVWAVIKENGETTNNHLRNPRSISRRLPSAARMIPGVQKHQHIDDNSNNESELVQSSAPVNIPDWSKIYGKSPVKKMIYGGCSSSFDYEDDNDYDLVLEDDNEEYAGDGRLPPHEWLAKKLARSQISSFSVCEGVGRTLKGRDLSRVRNAILSKTGFL
ncbi:hypothetical protein SOVF_094840 [Spinacia oleracea]|nr:hypothetical protein SOVF_094840 [Spinacia oleracea]